MEFGRIKGLGNPFKQENRFRHSQSTREASATEPRVRRKHPSLYRLQGPKLISWIIKKNPYFGFKFRTLSLISYKLFSVPRFNAPNLSSESGERTRPQVSRSEPCLRVRRQHLSLDFRYRALSPGLDKASVFRIQVPNLITGSGKSIRFQVFRFRTLSPGPKIASVLRFQIPNLFSVSGGFKFRVLGKHPFLGFNQVGKDRTLSQEK